ncbi:MCE family protein [Mycolicibacterium palauense]|uniref:MCE family protein n=1 Tax=Mycolicibacterium palauense TaxID=2034511 RepID=UPI000BFEC1F2|nr:MCE family protein [Mycolicibacterium palauense]
MKSFAERNPAVLGAVGAGLVSVVVIGALQYQNLPLVNQNHSYTAYFADAGGLFTGAGVEVSGYPAGKVSSIVLDGAQVLVTFTVDDDIHLGRSTEAAIKTKSLLGTKVLDVTPRGGGALTGTIPLSRTTSPYQLPDALGDLADTISGLDTDQLSQSLAVVSQTFADTPEALRGAVDGVARFADTLNRRDARLRTLLDNAARATTVLAGRSDAIVRLVHDTNALLAQLKSQSDAVDRIWDHLTALSDRLAEFIDDNRAQLRPALDKLNGVLTIVDGHRDQLKESVKLLNSYAMSLGESLSSGPFFKAYVSNLLPGQFVQPFVEAAFSDLGLDPSVLLPSQLSDPQTGQPATPPLPLPFPRTGQGGPPATDLPAAITGHPGDPRYPYRPPLPAPPPGGPAPGPPAGPEPGAGPVPTPAPSPVYVPAPDEVAP